ncbi:MAG: CinA family nicotinamide mononucleotide deamidase-related protein [Desulfatiglans sp.]|jgi:nicotinamide-nucleotide amidase|nr:CinA family nicotinamide mononucleotide deamidase-related protein [Desulfatiglans sp.]
MKQSAGLPKCEIITIGTELLLGQIIDTNSTFLAEALGRTGVMIHFRTSVGDRLEEMDQVIRNAVERCDMVIITGGLGPTLDDLTRESVARTAGVELEFRQDLMDRIEEMFTRAGYQMPENNRRQAFIPAGAEAIPNPMGTAPGFMKEIDDTPVICLPGVPRELRYLLDHEVLPWVKKRFDLDDHLVTYRVLKTAGISESKVDRVIADLMEPGRNPEVGLLASQGEIKIRIAARAVNEEDAWALIQGVEEEICARLGEKVFGRDTDSLEGVVDSLLAERGWTLGILETFTGGLITQKLHRLPSRQLVEGYVINRRNRLSRYLDDGDFSPEEESALSVSRGFKNKGLFDVCLVVIGFPIKKEKDYALRGTVAVIGEGMEETFDWDMGGALPTLQERGSVIGLNTLRLALSDG